MGWGERPLRSASSGRGGEQGRRGGQSCAWQPGQQQQQRLHAAAASARPAASRLHSSGQPAHPLASQPASPSIPLQNEPAPAPCPPRQGTPRAAAQSRTPGPAGTGAPGGVQRLKVESSHAMNTCQQQRRLLQCCSRAVAERCQVVGRRHCRALPASRAQSRPRLLALPAARLATTPAARSRAARPIAAALHGGGRRRQTCGRRRERGCTAAPPLLALTIRVMATITPDTPKMKPASDSASWATSCRPATALGCTVLRRATRTLRAGSANWACTLGRLQGRAGGGGGRGVRAPPMCVTWGGPRAGSRGPDAPSPTHIAPASAPDGRLLLLQAGGASHGRRGAQSDCHHLAGV